jgi:hypothetical protein
MHDGEREADSDFGCSTKMDLLLEGDEEEVLRGLIVRENRPFIRRGLLPMELFLEYHGF